MWVTSCQEEMCWEFEDFEKHGSWELGLGYVGRQLGCLPQWQTIEVGVRRWWWEVGSDYGVVSIVRHERLLRIVSLFVSKNWSQKLINGSYLNNGVACVFESAYWFVFVHVHSATSKYTQPSRNTTNHSLKRAAAGIGLHVNAHKSEYMCFN